MTLSKFPLPILPHIQPDCVGLNRGFTHDFDIAITHQVLLQISPVFARSTTRQEKA